MIKIVLIETQLRDLIAGKIVKIRSDFMPDTDITVREIGVAGILRTVAGGLSDLADDMANDFGDEDGTAETI